MGNNRYIEWEEVRQCGCQDTLSLIQLNSIYRTPPFNFLLISCNDARSYMARPVVVDARLISN